VLRRQVVIAEGEVGELGGLLEQKLGVFTPWVVAIEIFFIVLDVFFAADIDVAFALA